MDWIERWFGMSPDNGDGSLEGLVVVTLVVVAVCGLVSRSEGLRRRLHAMLGAARAALVRSSPRHR